MFCLSPASAAAKYPQIKAIGETSRYVEVPQKPSIWELTKKQVFWHLDQLFCFFRCMDFYSVHVLLSNVMEKGACTSRGKKKKRAFV